MNHFYISSAYKTETVFILEIEYIRVSERTHLDIVKHAFDVIKKTFKQNVLNTPAWRISS